MVATEEDGQSKAVNTINIDEVPSQSPKPEAAETSSKAISY